MKRDDAIQLMGEPHSDNNYGYGSHGIMYAWYELFYDGITHEITGIQNDHLMVRSRAHKTDIYFETEKAKLDKRFLRYTKNLSYDTVLAILDKQNVPHSKAMHFNNEIIMFSSGVYLDFDIELKSQQTVLNGIRIFKLK